MEEKIKNLINDALKNGIELPGLLFSVSHPKNLEFGDFSTDLFMVNMASFDNIHQKKVLDFLEENKPEEVEKIDVQGKFINFHLSREFFAKSVEEILNQGEGVGKNESLSGQKIMVEYTDPNPFKPFHIGHLMTNAIGESIARVLEHSGAAVSRANYQGDVGLHVAKAMWAILKDPLRPEINSVHLPLRRGRTGGGSSTSVFAQYIGDSYVMGSEAYETDTKAKEEIDILNKKIYEMKDPEVIQVYDWGFKVTMEAFEDLYKLLGTKFEFYFLESQMAPFGEKIVKDNLGKVFEESDGAIVFKAEKHNPKLHTRVFITSKGLPTYETKELGLTQEKFLTLPNMDLSIVITANEQMDYMRVVSQALSLIHPEYEKKMKHITHGMMRLAAGKMSSRKGNVVTGESLIMDTIALVQEKLKERDWDEEQKDTVAKIVGISALKYSILKQSTGGDIAYDFEKSISFEGDSGPYLQYSYARANSILEKAQRENILPDPHAFSDEIFEVEKLLYKFPEVVARSAQEYEPHYIASYLIEVARSYNSFYANTVIVSKEDKTSAYKVALTYSFSFVMKTGLHLLGIQAPAKM